MNLTELKAMGPFELAAEVAEIEQPNHFGSAGARFLLDAHHTLIQRIQVQLDAGRALDAELIEAMKDDAWVILDTNDAAWQTGESWRAFVDLGCQHTEHFQERIRGGVEPDNAVNVAVDVLTLVGFDLIHRLLDMLADSISE